MSIWNKVLIGLIIVASLGYFYLAAVTLKTHKYWRSVANAQKAKIEQYKEETKILKEGQRGEDAAPGIRQTRMALYKLLIDRGRVWDNCMPERVVDAERGVIRLTTDSPDPHRITNKMVLDIFEEKPIGEGGRYLGEFRVTAAGDQPGDKQIALEPSTTMPPEQLERLLASQGPWTLYEVLPSDNHDVLAGLSEEELRKLLPAGTVEQYINDKPPNERKLRDYQVLFREYDRQRSVLVDAKKAIDHDKRFIDSALADARQQVQFRQAEITALKAELAKFEQQRDVVIAHGDNLQNALDARQARIEKLVADNVATAGRIAKIQLEATRRIDERTRKMAQQ